jgi:hypothetical protein
VIPVPARTVTTIGDVSEYTWPTAPVPGGPADGRRVPVRTERGRPGDRCRDDRSRYEKGVSFMIITITKVEHIEATSRHTVEGGLA